jgi:hypothetical protein
MGDGAGLAGQYSITSVGLGRWTEHCQRLDGPPEGGETIEQTGVDPCHTEIHQPSAEKSMPHSTT